MLDGVRSPVGGNAEAVALLERHLRLAQEGRTAYATVTRAQAPDEVSFEAAGSVDFEGLTEGALEQLKRRIHLAQINRMPPDADPNAPANVVCYPLSCMPTGYDFLPWLIDREMERRREGAPKPLRVCLYAGRNGATGIATEYRRRMLEGVLWPLLPMVGAVEDPAAVNGRQCPVLHYRNMVAAARVGESVPRLTPSDHARATIANYVGGQKVVTITLREAEHYRHRNSNLEAWTRLAEVIDRQGFPVVFVRDTAKAFEPFSEWPICPQASLNLDMRVALYEQAALNLFVSNGPFTLCLFSSAPFLSFIEIDDEDEAFPPNHSSWWRDCCAIDPGEQFPWCAPNQRIIWKRDKFENLIEAWGSAKP